jgi:hypothetical protein
MILGFALAVLSWPSSPKGLTVTSGTAGSWQSALEMAAHNGMAFGTRIVFTYGPLGFLTTQQLNFPSTTFASFVFTLAFFTVLFTILIWSLRRFLPLWGAIPVAYVVGAVSLHTDGGVPEDVYALVLIVCVAVLSRPDKAPTPGWIWAGLGVVFSVFSLVKVSLGLGLLVVLILTVVCLCRGRWQAVKAFALGAVPTFCLAWFGTGNGLGNVMPFARSSAAIISGYGPAMSIDYPYGYLFPNRTFAYWWAAFVVIVIGAFAFAHGHKLAPRARVGIGLVTLVVVWLLFKEGFVRHDSLHDLIFFAAAPLLVAAFDLGRRFWAVQLAGLSALCVVTGIVAGGMSALVYQPWASASNFVHEATTLVSPAQQDDVIHKSRKRLQVGYGVPSQMLALLRGQTADVSPVEQTAAWAYPEVHFDPLPVIQDYSAYTSSLDQLDRSYLATPEAPRFILRKPGAVDGRNPAFEPPATQLAIECRYRQVMATTAWQLLESGSDRCGAMRSLGTVTTGFKHWVTVPAAPPGDSIVASFHLSLGPSWTLRAILFKPPYVFMGYNHSKQHWRFVAATAPDLHVLHAASTLSYSPPFVPVSVIRLRFLVNGASGSQSGVRVSFYAIPVAACPSGSPYGTGATPGAGTQIRGVSALAGFSSGPDQYNLYDLSRYNEQQAADAIYDNDPTGGLAVIQEYNPNFNSSWIEIPNVPNLPVVSPPPENPAMGSCSS